MSKDESEIIAVMSVDGPIVGGYSMMSSSHLMVDIDVLLSQSTPMRWMVLAHAMRGMGLVLHTIRLQRDGY